MAKNKVVNTSAPMPSVKQSGTFA
ncbi:MAG: hypothetical protein RL711_1072, partial [Bacteroidota bacterium]